MRLLFSLAFSLLSFISFSQSWKPQNGSRTVDDAVTVFTNATLYQNGQHLPEMQLLIQNGKIKAVGKEVMIPKGAIVKDMQGKFIYPSFIEIYSNFGLPKVEENKNSWSEKPQLESKKIGPYYWHESIKAEENALDDFSFDQKKAEQYRKMGFGTINTHHADGVMRGTSVLVQLHDNALHQVINPKTSAVYSFFKGSSKQTYPRSLMGMIASIRQAQYDAAWYAANQNELDYNATLEAVQNNTELPLLFDAGSTQSILRALKIAQEFDLEFYYRGNGSEYERLAELEAATAKVIVDLNFPKPYDVSDPFLNMRLPLSKMKAWELAQYNLALLEQKAIEFSLSAHELKKEIDFFENIRTSIENGVSFNAVMEALTVNPAAYLGEGERLGQLAAGYHANFIITSDTLFQKESRLLENWVYGEQHEIEAEPYVDIEGIYNLNINKKKQYQLSVSKSKQGYKSELKAQNNDKVIPSKLSLSAYRINLEFREGEQYYQLSGRVSDSLSRIWTGKVLQDGKWQAWAAIRKIGDRPENDTADTVQDSSEIEFPSIYFPNMAYGWDSLPTKAEAILFRNATLWTNEEDGILKNHDLLIADGKILMYGYKINMEIMFPDLAGKVKEIDATDKHITSGIIDEHSHIAISRGVNEGSQAVTAEVSIADVVNASDINLYRQLSGGVTAAQLLHGSANPIGGQSALIKLRWGNAPEQMKIAEADGFIKFALGENVKQSNWGEKRTVRFPQTRMGVEQVFYDAFLRAKEYKEEQLLYEAKSKSAKKKSIPPRRDLELEALREILDSQRFITCHSYIQSEINMLMHVADSMGFQINTFTHILEGYKVADKMREHGVAASTFSDWWAYKYEVNDAIPYNGAILHEQGVLTGFNSDDAEMGRRLNQEAAKAIKYGGVSEEDAWKFVTLNPAKMLHLDDRMGSLKAEKDADIVIWNDHPMSIYALAEQTYIDGLLYFDRDRNELLTKRNAAERQRLIAKMAAVKAKGKETQKIDVKKKELYHCDSLEQ